MNYYPGKGMSFSTRPLKTYYTTPEGSYGRRIFIPANIDLPDWAERLLKRFSLWGNCSSDPERYRMYEFPWKRSGGHFNYDLALTVLHNLGFSYLDPNGKQA